MTKFITALSTLIKNILNIEILLLFWDSNSGLRDPDASLLPVEQLPIECLGSNGPEFESKNSWSNFPHNKIPAGSADNWLDVKIAGSFHDDSGELDNGQPKNEKYKNRYD